MPNHYSERSTRFSGSGRKTRERTPVRKSIIRQTKSFTGQKGEGDAGNARKLTLKQPKRRRQRDSEAAGDNRQEDRGSRGGEKRV